jgi:hypothetical protein
MAGSRYLANVEVGRKLESLDGWVELDEPELAGDTGAMPTAYKNSRGHDAVRQWYS